MNIGEFFGAVNSVLGAAGLPPDLLPSFGSWASNVAQGLPKWRTAFGSTACRARGCSSFAVHECVACGSAVCLKHAFISESADVCCHECVGSMVAARFADRESNRSQNQRRERQRARDDAPPPPPRKKDRVAEARRILGVDPGDDWDVIKGRYRQLARKHHPDRAQTPAARRKAEERMRKINDAFAVLRDLHQEAA